MANKHHYEDSMGIGRKESPAIEYAFQDECVRTLKELCEEKGLYQNLRINESIFDGLPAEFCKEFRKRPVTPHSRGEGDDDRMPWGGGASQPLGTPNDEMDAGFYLPNINLQCARCQRATTFLSMTILQRSFGGPYPLLGEDTEQIFTLHYRCAVCRNSFVVFQVLRRGFKFQLTGRSVPYRPEIAKEWPKIIQEVVRDAYVAAAENDLPAAYYHLRTAAEFYLKSELSITTGTRIDGSDLCEKYNATIDDRLRTGLPSLTSIYSELSVGLHTRDVSTDRFSTLCKDFLAHLKMKALLAEYS